MVAVILAGSAVLLGVGLVNGQATTGSAAVGSASDSGGVIKANEVQGLTVASKRSQLAFHTMGIVDQVMVKEGESVKAGQVLMKLDDRAERATLAGLEVDANSQANIKAAEVELATKRLTHGRIERMYNDKVANLEEFEQSKLEVELAEIKVDQAREDLQRKIADRDHQKILVDSMNLKAVFDGVVEKMDMHVGEVVEQQKPAVTMVLNDPLWVEANMPSATAGRLVGVPSLKVRYINETKQYDARVILLSPVVDAASDWRLVRLEMPNPENRPSGMRVFLQLPPEPGSISKGE